MAPSHGCWQKASVPCRMGPCTGLPECSHNMASSTMSELGETARRKLQGSVLEVTYYGRQECQESRVTRGHLGGWQPLRQRAMGGSPATPHLWRVHAGKNRTGFPGSRLPVFLPAHGYYAPTMCPAHRMVGWAGLAHPCLPTNVCHTPSLCGKPASPALEPGLIRNQAQAHTELLFWQQLLMAPS